LVCSRIEEDGVSAVAPRFVLGEKIAFLTVSAVSSQFQ